MPARGCGGSGGGGGGGGAVGVMEGDFHSNTVATPATATAAIEGDCSGVKLLVVSLHERRGTSSSSRGSSDVCSARHLASSGEDKAAWA